MSYIPTEWKTGDIVTAAKLNKLEEGVASGGGGGGGLLVKAEPHTEGGEGQFKLSATYADIISAFDADGLVQFVFYPTDGIIFSLELMQVFADEGDYGVVLKDLSGEMSEGEMPFLADSATGTLIYSGDV